MTIALYFDNNDLRTFGTKARLTEVLKKLVTEGLDKKAADEIIISVREQLP
jgi:hypothetical protein